MEAGAMLDTGNGVIELFANAEPGRRPGQVDQTVPIKGLRQLTIPMASLPEQQEIVAILDRLLGREALCANGLRLFTMSHRNIERTQTDHDLNHKPGQFVKLSTPAAICPQDIHKKSTGLCTGRKFTGYPSGSHN